MIISPALASGAPRWAELRRDLEIRYLAHCLLDPTHAESGQTVVLSPIGAEVRANCIADQRGRWFASQECLETLARIRRAPADAIALCREVDRVTLHDLVAVRFDDLVIALSDPATQGARSQTPPWRRPVRSTA